MDGKARSICLTLPVQGDQAGPKPAHECRITLTREDLASIMACARRAKAGDVRGVVLDFEPAEFTAVQVIRRELVVSHAEGTDKTGHAVFQVRGWHPEGHLTQTAAVTFPLSLEGSGGAIIGWLQSRYHWSLPLKGRP